MSRKTDEFRTLTAKVRVDLDRAAGDDSTGLCPVEVEAYSGADVEFYGEKEVFDLEGLEASGSEPFLMDHDPQRAAGFSQEVDNNGRRLVLRGQLLAEEEDGGLVVRRAGQGFPWQASVRVKVLEEEYVPEGQSREINGRTFAGPFWHDKRCLLREVSFTTLGKDHNTRARLLSVDAPDNPSKEAGMDEKEIREAAMKAERKRVADLRAAFPEDPDFALEHVDQGSTVEQAKAAYADKLAAELKKERAAKEQALADVEEARKASASQGTVVPFRRAPAGGDVDPSTGNDRTAAERWQEAVSKLAERMPRSEAVRKAAVDDPALHRAYLEESNAGSNYSMPGYLRSAFSKQEA